MWALKKLGGCQTKIANMIAWIHYKNVQASSLDVSEIDLKIH